uniref:(northern house mosquito) hypothetical protein n=1 Tax=Culex pipiens TaxID=7175 RepID=A0A8D8MNP9_CULPI
MIVVEERQTIPPKRVVDVSLRSSPCWWPLLPLLAPSTDMATDSKDSEDTDTDSKDSVDMVDKNKDRASEVMVLKLTEAVTEVMAKASEPDTDTDNSTDTDMVAEDINRSKNK